MRAVDETMNTQPEKCATRGLLGRSKGNRMGEQVGVPPVCLSGSLLFRRHNTLLCPWHPCASCRPSWNLIGMMNNRFGAKEGCEGSTVLPDASDWWGLPPQ